MRRLIGPILLANIAAPLPPFLIGALGVEVRRELDVSTTALGVAAAMFFATTALLSPPMGRLVGRVGWMQPLRVGAIGTTLALLGLAATTGVAWLGSMLALAGVANAIVVPATNAALSAAVPAQRLGLAVGITQSSVPISGVVAGASVPLAASQLGWSTVILISAVIPVLAAAMLLFLRENFVTANVAIGSPTQSAVARKSALRWATLSTALATAVTAVLGTLFVSLLTGAGTSPTVAGALLTVGGVTGALVRAASGALIPDLAVNGMRVVQALLICGVVGALLLAWSGNAAALVVVATVLLFAGGWGWPAAFYGALLPRHVSNPADATGVVLTGMAVGAIIGPPVFATIVDRGSTAAACVGLAVVAAAAAAAGRRSDGLYRA